MPMWTCFVHVRESILIPFDHFLLNLLKSGIIDFKRVNNDICTYVIWRMDMQEQNTQSN